MGDKYKIKKDDLKALFATVEMHMENRYHTYYTKLGQRKGPNGNFFCWNTEAHPNGTDLHPSVSIDNKTGRWHCFTCGIKGNFQSYWKEYIRGADTSYTDWIIDFLGLASSSMLGFSTSTTDPDFEKNSQQLKELHKLLQDERVKSTGRPWILSGELTQLVKEKTTLPMDLLDNFVDLLLASPESLKYLKDTRNITPEVVKKYRIGMTEKGKFIFPMIDGEGSLLNVKAYDPRGDRKFKWTYPFKGYETCPTPINNFTQQKLYFFAGEPDMYCAVSFGFPGAVTMGSEAAWDVDKVFGQERARQLFLGKEIVVCLDSDETGLRQAQKLAGSLYPYAKQIKILNLDKSDINPNGLDPNLVQEIEVDGKKKTKRIEKDFTEFLHKNGFDEIAKMKFIELEENTIVYTQNTDRVQKEIFKVTLQESRLPRYYSADGTKILELVASVSDFKDSALFYPKSLQVSCREMGCPDKLSGACKNCMLPTKPGFADVKTMTFNFVREIPKDQTTNPFYIKLCEHDILGLVETTENQMMAQIKSLCGINDRCKFSVIRTGEPEKLIHVKLAKDVNEYGDASMLINTGGADIGVEAYMVACDIYPNRSYKFEAVQTTAWNGQHAVLFIHKAEPIATCIDTFKMDEKTHNMLCVFRPKSDETIAQHLKRRYDIFAHAAGVTGRRELFYINDLAFFSPLEIHNKRLLPSVTRGWVEVLIAGDTRTCKTMVAKFLHNHYKVGDIVVGSTAVSRSGLIGGMDVKSKRISWGRIPINDGGLIIIDELSLINESVLSDLTGVRSDGIAIITGMVSGKMLARCRKIMLSNAREWKAENSSGLKGIPFLKNLCFKDEILARFDIAFVVARDDVDIERFESLYRQLTSEFTEFQSQNLMRWAMSRKPEDIIFEDGFEEAVNNAQILMNRKYHSSTQLVNQEMRAKLVRMAVSTATMLYSTPEDDWNKVLVRKEHLDYVVEFLNFIYCHKNMELDKYSEQKRASETLGDMNFMENICKYIDINQLNSENEFTERAIHQIFYDYLQRVQTGHMLIPDARSDGATSTFLKIFESVPKLIGLLISRNCFSRTRRGTYRKTDQFTQWIAMRKENENATVSNILERPDNKQDVTVNEAAQKFAEINRKTAQKGRY